MQPFPRGVFTNQGLFHQLANQLGVSHGVLQGKVCHEQGLAIEKLGIVFRLLRVSRDGGLHNLEDRMLCI